ncbi:MAG: hypothetical protein J5J00_13600 [Deltaproteobacteria bacterium]|nr:hypothetical protein [Deltaproteobacteria bacterium]
MPEPSNERTQAPVSAGEKTEYQPRFKRSRWTHAGTEIDRFFDRFVPSQYEDGFAWRCRVIGKGEEDRIVSFEEQPEKVQRIIAANAEVLLELYQETSPTELDIMREAGKKIAVQGLINPDMTVEGDIPSLRDGMSRHHHEKWLAQFQADLASGKRTDTEHRGAKPFDELPPIELTVMKVQTWGNWRILAGLSDGEYELLRSFSEKHEKLNVKP